VASPKQVAEMTKAAAAQAYGATRILGDHGAFFSFSGPSIDKMAQLLPEPGAQMLSESQARFTLSAMGCPSRRASRFLKLAQRPSGVCVYGLRPPIKEAVTLKKSPQGIPKGIAKDPVASIARKATDKITDRELVRRMGGRPAKIAQEGELARAKCAALMPEMPGWLAEGMGPAPPMWGMEGMEEPALPPEEGVESLLSVGFLNRDNAEFFVAQLPQLEKTVNLLAQMLLALRMKPESAFIEEDIVREALNHMEDVVDALQGLAE